MLMIRCGSLPPRPYPDGLTILNTVFRAQRRPCTAISCSESLVQPNVPLVIVRLMSSVHPARHSTKTLLALSM